MWGFFSVALVAVAAAIFVLLRRYAAPSVPLVVMATTTYAWLVAFIVVVRSRLGYSLVGRDSVQSKTLAADAPLQRHRSCFRTTPTSNQTPAGASADGCVCNAHQACRQPRGGPDVGDLLLVNADLDLDGAAVFPGVCRRGRLYCGGALHDVAQGARG